MAGAPADAQLRFETSAAIVRILGIAFKTLPPRTRRALAPNRVEILSAPCRSPRPGIAITPRRETDPWMQPMASIAGTDFGDRRLAKWRPGRNLRWLESLGRKSRCGSLPGPTMQNLSAFIWRGLPSPMPAEINPTPGQPPLPHLYGRDIRRRPRRAPLLQISSKSTFGKPKSHPMALRIWRGAPPRLQSNVGRRKSGSAPAKSATRKFSSRPAPCFQRNPRGPMNTCPVTNKPSIRPNRPQFEGHPRCLLLKDCKAGFEKDPAACLPRLGIALPTPLIKSQP